MNTIDDRLPRYQRLRDQIAAEIAANVWGPGDAIPSESELAAIHKVALGTVRRAIDVLVADGLVERSQGRGTFVRRPSFDNSLLRFLRHHGGDQATVPQSRILQRDVMAAPPDVARNLSLAQGAEVIRLVRLRLVDGHIVMGEEIWLPKVRFAPIFTVGLDDMGDLLYPTYERLCGQSIASAQETLTVEAVGAEHAQLLGLKPGEPVVVIERLARGYDRHPLEWRLSRAPAATFRYHIDIN
ncbi:MAG: GntR family transcriptional regulator [Rhodospirillaceae bacterium]|nr:GntR family transcriptional regulator [Rhodospirillales bacterium]